MPLLLLKMRAYRTTDSGALDTPIPKKEEKSNLLFEISNKKSQDTKQ